MLTVNPGASFAVSISAPTGLGTAVGVQIVVPGQALVVLPRTTVGIAEFPAGSGAYGVTLVAPMGPGAYVIIFDWAAGGALTAVNSTTVQVTVNAVVPVVYGQQVYVDPSTLISDQPLGSVAIPTAADVRASTSLDLSLYGNGLRSDSGPGGLQEMVDRAASAFFNITGQTLSEIDPKYAPQVRRVIRGMTEQVMMQGGQDVLDTQADWDLLSGFSAGPYNENHRSPRDMLDGRMLWPVPWISMALWGLLTPERYGFWMAFFTGVNQPAFAVTDVFWSEGQAIGRLDGPWGGYWGGA